MKTRSSSTCSWYLILLLLALVPPALGQDPNAGVTIYAIDPQASETGPDPGAFTVRRTGSLDYPLIVFYQLSGTASNGVDYERLEGSVQIPAGAPSAFFTVRPIDDSLVEGNETVVARLFPSPLACPTCGYAIGASSNAVVVISDNDFDRPPGVNIYATDASAAEQPAVGAFLPDTATFTVRRFGDTSQHIDVFYTIGGTASNGIDYRRISDHITLPAGVSSAEIVVDPIDDNLAEGTESVILTLIPQCPQCLFADPPCLIPIEGTNCFQIGPDNQATAYIRDNDPAPTNHPPFVRLNSPANGEAFIAPATITLRAYAQDAEDGYDLDVEFFEGPRSLGFGAFVPTLCPAPYCPYYELTWSNVPPGEYILTARATDSANATSVSDPVRVIVVESNRPPGVNIYATDPFAAEQPAVSTIPPDTATFTVQRGDVTADIVVFYTIGGTASNGDDYRRISNYVVLPRGASSAQIVVYPIDDNLAEGTETVTLTLIPQCPQCLFANPPCDVAQGTNCFQIGPDNQATAYMRDNDPAPTNHAPSVSLVAPQDGQTFVAPTNIHLIAFAQDEEDHYVLTVEFFEGTHSLGFGTFVPDRCAVCPNYQLTWSNVPPGEYRLTAKATDSGGASSVSDPVHITVREGNPAPGTKLWEFSQGIVYNDPAVWRDGTIYVPQGNNVVSLYALAPGGEVKWAQGLAGGGSSPAIADDGTIYVARADGQNSFRAYSPAGNLLWSIPLNVTHTFQGFASPSIARDGTIYVPAGGSLDKGLHALRPDGTLKWKFVPTGPQVFTPVVGSDGTIYFGVLNDGLYAVNPDGSLRWEKHMGGYSNHVWAAIGGDGSIYVVGSLPVQLSAFTAAGVNLWGTQIGSVTLQHASAPVIGADGSIYVVADKLYAFNSDGSRKWTFDTPDNAWSSLRAPAIDSQGNIYAGLGDFVTVNSNGSLLWSFAVNATTSATLTPDGKIYVGAGDILYALQANAGLAESPWPMFQRDPRHTGAAPLVPTTRPVVNIVARDPIAVEGPFCFSNWWWTTSWNSADWTTTPGLIDPNRCSGTNTATFVVHRSGPTNADLTIHYEIGGTASNGVDYVALSGSVTIPAGKRSAPIVTTPRDDTIAEGLETVVLRLRSSPDYTIGIPARAAALIVDNDRPRPPCRMLTDGNFHFCQPATNGYCYRIEASSDLVNWTSVCTNIVIDGALHFVDPDAPAINTRFYRALPEPGLSPDD